MNWQKFFYGITCLTVLVICSYVWASPQSDDSQPYFVVLEGPSVLMKQHQLSEGAPVKSAQFKAKSALARTYAQALATQQNAVMQKIATVDSSARVLYQYDRLINALAVEIDPAKRDSVREIPGVSYVSPIRPVKTCLTQSGTLMNLPQAWEKFTAGENAGEGIFIAIVDTGIDITHPAFDSTGFQYPEGFPKGNSAMTTEKIIAARVFPPQTGDRGDTSLFDRAGHGTNVATIAAANLNISSPLGILSGVAPKAYLGNYKVFTSEYSDNDQVIRAVESAVEDGADVINLSLGSDLFSDPQHDPQVVAIQNAIDLGVIVVVASGNVGGESYVIGNPAQVEGAITVGSITNAHYSSGDPADHDVYVTAFVGGEAIVDRVPGVVGGVNYGYSAGPYTVPIIGTFPVQDIDLLDGGGYGESTDGLACESLTVDQPLTGWALVSRGDCTFVSKIKNMQNAGARGVLFVDNKDENASNYVMNTPSVEGATLPSIMIQRGAGLMIKDALASGAAVTIRIEGPTITSRSMQSNRLSSFSSQGPSVHFSLKPDVVTIGEGSFAGTQNDYDELSSSFNASGFQWLSGTSMSAPRVSGLAAILRQEHPDWPPAWIKSAIMLSAQKGLQTSDGKTATVLQRGAGRVDAEAAVDVEIVVDPALINFGVHMVVDATPEARWITVVNVSDQSGWYSLVPANSANPHGVVISEESFALEPGEKKEIAIRLARYQTLANGDSEGELLLTHLNTEQAYRLPYWIRIQPLQDPYGDVLLIDDDGGKLFEEFYMDRLDDLGRQYTWWDVKSLGYPVLDFMAQFKTVIWFLSDNTLNPVLDRSSSAYRRFHNPLLLFQNELMKYLASGGRLFFSGQDYSDVQKNSVLSQEVLRLSYRDQQDGASSIQGVSNHAFTDGLGPFTLTFPQGFENWTDYLTVLDSSQVQRAFIADGNRSRTVGVTVDTCAYRVVFLAFALECLDTISGTTILRKSLDWLSGSSVAGGETGVGETHVGLYPELSGITPHSIDLSKETGPYSISIEGNGFAFKNGYRAYFDFIPVSGLTREGCNTLTGDVPAGIEPGTYTLRLVTGDGQELRLESALTVKNDSGTDVLDWAIY